MYPCWYVTCVHLFFCHIAVILWISHDLSPLHGFLGSKIFFYKVPHDHSCTCILVWIRASVLQSRNLEVALFGCEAWASSPSPDCLSELCKSSPSLGMIRLLNSFLSLKKYFLKTTTEKKACVIGYLEDVQK